MHYAITGRYACTKSISVNPNPNPNAIWIVASARQSLNWDPWILFSFQGKDECAFCCVLIATFAIRNVSGSLPHRQRVDKNCFPVCVRKKFNKTSFYLANDLFGYWEVMETTTVKQGNCSKDANFILCSLYTYHAAMTKWKNPCFPVAMFVRNFFATVGLIWALLGCRRSVVCLKPRKQALSASNPTQSPSSEWVMGCTW